LLKLIAFGSLANLAFPLTSLITGPLLARALDPIGRGEMALLLSPISLANMALTLGLPESLIWHSARGTISRRYAYQMALGGGFGCGVIGAALMIFFGPMLLTADQAHFAWSLRLIAMTLPITLTLAAFRGVVVGRQHFMYANSERMSASLLRLAAIGIFFLTGMLNPVLAAWTTVLSGIAGSVVLLFPLTKQLDLPAISLVGGRSVACYAGSAALGTVGGFLMLRLDQIIMIPLTATEQLGFYAVAVSLAEVPAAFVNAIRDLIFALGAERNEPAVAAQSCRLALTVFIPICAAAACVTPVVIPILFGKSFMPAVPIAQILFLGTVASAVSSLLGAGLMSLGHAGVRSLVQIGGAGITVLLTIVLVPRYGGMGAALGATLTYIITGTCIAFAYIRYTGVPVADCFIPSRVELGLFIRQARERAFRSKAIRKS
jgi:O-antigen/teichoic acid export membrane protein